MNFCLKRIEEIDGLSCESPKGAFYLFVKLTNLEDQRDDKKWVLDHKNPQLILVPPYYANAHLCLTKFCLLHYKWSYRGKYFDANKQNSYRWNDPKLKIKWPIKKPILSKRDKISKLL